MGPNAAEDFAIYAIDHVQLAMPAGEEARAEEFYAGHLGLQRVPKPAALAARGGCWFEGEGVQLHLGVEEPFHPARKAHPALLVRALPQLLQRLRAAGVPVREDGDLPGYERAFVEDPFGNRLELMQPTVPATFWDDRAIAVHGYRLALAAVEEACSELDPGRAAEQPPGLPNHALWTLGHLTFSAQAIGGELGLEPWLPADWAARYGPGSEPRPNPQDYEGLHALRAALDQAATQVVRRIERIPRAAWCGPLPDERYRNRFPSLAHAVHHILSGHTSQHAGQLSLWRRALGEGS